jgi:hypothetical protein
MRTYVPKLNQDKENKKNFVRTVFPTLKKEQNKSIYFDSPAVSMPSISIESAESGRRFAYFATGFATANFTTL